MANTARRDKGTGTVFPHPTRNPNGDDNGPHIGRLDAGLTATGGRRRITVTGTTKADARKKLDRKRAQIAAEGVTVGRAPSVKTYAEKYVTDKQIGGLRPKPLAALRSNVRKWIIPTIGHVRVDELTPDHVRMVERAIRAAGGSAGNAAAVHRNLMAMIRHAVVDGGHMVPTRTLMSKAPKKVKNDRVAFSVEEARKVLKEAEKLPHGVRWLLAILYGMRQGEVLGLRWSHVDLVAGTIAVDWQLMEIKYRDRKAKALGLEIPDDFDAVQLVGTWALTRPKTEAGHRLLPLHPYVVEALRVWKDAAPVSSHDLVFPDQYGGPTTTKGDRAEFHALQKAAGVAHPDGRYYHVHECRHTTATRLKAIGASDKIAEGTLGQAKLVGTYVHEDLAAKSAALVTVAAELVPAIEAAEKAKNKPTRTRAKKA